MSGPSPRINVVRLNDGEGEARRKAGLPERRESLFLLLLLNGGQGAATGRRACCRQQPAHGKRSAEDVAELDTSTPTRLLFGVPGGQRARESKE